MTTEYFTDNKYCTIEKLIPIDICRIVNRYALMKEKIEFTPEIGVEAQVKNAHSVYGDTLMETLIHFLQPHIENATGLKLCPTYTYYRVYRPGMDLKVHRDRPSCEISSTICFGYKYVGKTAEYRWGMFVQPGRLICQNPGDAIIYRGCEVDHWRDSFDAGPGSYQVQAFFHFINKNGQFFPEYAYDKRLQVGMPHVSTKGINN